jgi:hypothetical protein
MSGYEPIAERDVEAPVEDATEQAQAVDPDDGADERATDPSDDPEVDEADAADQRLEVGLPDDDYRA